MTNPRASKSNRVLRPVRLGLATGLAVLFFGVLLGGLQGMTPAQAGPGPLYVDGAAGSDTTDCTNPAAPCATIGYALTQAGNGDEIRVAEGTYMETLDIHITVTLKGGYEMAGWTRDIAAHSTIVDADRADDAVFNITPDINVTVEGFTVQGANHTSDWGGGFYINDATVVISGTVIRDNSTDGSGGGVFVEGDSNVSLINSTVTANVASGASGIQSGYPPGPVPGHVTIRDTVFTANTGGAVLGLDGQTFEVVGGQVVSNAVSKLAIDLAGSGTISGTAILSNTSGMRIRAGGVVSAQNLTIRGNTGGIANGAVLTITNSLIENNSGGDWPLIGSENEAAPDTTRLVIHGSTIRGNNGTPGIVGINTGYGEIRDSRIVDNDNAAINGDIINVGGVGVELVNVLLADNKSARPVVNGNSATGTISLMNVTAAGNTVANFPILAGEGIWTVINSIVWGNTTPGDMLGFGTFSVSYSDIESGWAGTGNINADPLFVDAADGDYHLGVGSPCTDKGTPAGAPTHDIEGTPRDATPDMGAYEWGRFRIFLPLLLRNFGP